MARPGEPRLISGWRIGRFLRVGAHAITARRETVDAIETQIVGMDGTSGIGTAVACHDHLDQRQRLLPRIEHAALDRQRPPEREVHAGAGLAGLQLDGRTRRAHKEDRRSRVTEPLTQIGRSVLVGHRLDGILAGFEPRELVASVRVGDLLDPLRTGCRYHGHDDARQRPPGSLFRDAARDRHGRGGRTRIARLRAGLRLGGRDRQEEERGHQPRMYPRTGWKHNNRGSGPASRPNSRCALIRR